jgi:hypothetical protein
MGVRRKRLQANSQLIFSVAFALRAVWRKEGASRAKVRRILPETSASVNDSETLPLRKLDIDILFLGR